MDGFIVSPPSTIPVAPMLSKSLRLPSPATTATTAVRRSSDPGCAEPFLALRRLQLHVRDLDALDGAEGSACPECGSGIVRVDVRLERRVVADHEQRVSERRQVAFQIRAFEPLAFDDEARAVAVARSRQVHGVRRQGRRRCGLGERLAREVRGDPAHDLDEARGSGVDDARVPQLLELLLRPGDSLVAVGDEGGEELPGSSSRRRSASSASSRTTVRIVPSTGSRTAA